MELLAGTVTVDDVDAFVERLQAVGRAHGVTVQAFDGRYVVDRAHVERAVELADRALARGENVADDRAVEILLYAAGRRQINRAFEMGVSAGEAPVVVLVDDPDGTGESGVRAGSEAERQAAATLRESLSLAAASEDDLRAYDRDRVCEFFGVDAAELGAVEGDLADVVRERVALLDVGK